MYCKCCRKFHSIDFSDVIAELVSDSKRTFYNGFSLEQIDILKRKLQMANVELTAEGLNNIQIINNK